MTVDSLLWLQVGDDSASHDPVLHRDDLESLLNEVICHRYSLDYNHRFFAVPSQAVPADQCYPTLVAALPRTVSIHHYFHVGGWPPPTCRLLPPGASYLGVLLSSGPQSQEGVKPLTFQGELVGPFRDLSLTPPNAGFCFLRWTGRAQCGARVFDSQHLGGRCRRIVR